MAAIKKLIYCMTEVSIRVYLYTQIRTSKKIDLPASELRNDCRPGQHLDYNLVQDGELGPPS